MLVNLIKKAKEKVSLLVQKVKQSKLAQVLGVAGGALMVSGTRTFAAAPSHVVDFTGVTPGFSVADILTSSVGFYTIFVSFIVLIIAIKFAPQLINFVFFIFGKSKSNKNA